MANKVESLPKSRELLFKEDDALMGFVKALVSLKYVVKIYTKRLLVPV